MFAKMNQAVPGASSHNFSLVPKAEIQRSSFNRQFNYKTTFNAGYLVPFYVDEALPGDTFKFKGSFLARLATPLRPVMDNMYLDVFWFSVPMRLLWTNWERFNGARDNPDDSIDFLTPQVVAGAGGFTSLSIEDYMGLPLGVGGLSVNAFHHRAYNLIFNEWFRDQNLMDSLAVPKGDGPDTASTYILQRRCKRHDYFTSCLPWPQKGEPVSFPIGGNAPVFLDPTTINYPKFITDPADSPHVTDVATLEAIPNVAVASTEFHLGRNGTHASRHKMDPNGTLLTSLADATAGTVSAFREAVQLQRILERDARGGTRYVEFIKAHFGVTSPDFRLQRPELLGTQTIPVNISAIPQTGATAATGNLGDLAAFGTSMGRGGFIKSFVEHEVIIGLLSVRADLTYQQGLPRMFSRRTRYDYYLPATAHLGEQAVLNKEIYCNGTSADNDVFGYQERWAEYRYGLSKITGKFRSTDAQTLDVWHLAQEFAGTPTLSDGFIQENPPVERVIAVQSEPQFLLDAFCSVESARPMPLYSVPGLVDHF